MKSLLIIFILLLSCSKEEFINLKDDSGLSHPMLGWQIGKERSIKHSKYHGSELVFSATYSTNGRGLRKTLSNREASKHLILIGGSNTFGEGVDDQHTFGNLLASRLKDFEVYNFGDRGYGPAHGLVQLKEKLVSSVVASSRGVMIYYFIPDLIRRVSPSFSYRSYGQDAPLFKFDLDNNLVVSGKVKLLPWILNNRPLLFLLDFFVRSDLKLVTRIIKEIEREYLKDFAGGEFILYLSPFYRWDPLFISELKRSGLNFLLPKREQAADYCFEYDYHLNVRGHELIADQLFRAISKSHR